MRASMTGEAVAGRLAGVEAIKWIAFVLMVLDHVARYAVPGMGPLPWLLGRLVFPLFAIALGMTAGEARADGSRADLVLRLAVWGGVAQAAMLFAAPSAVSLNVLFTFASGVTLFHACVTRSRRVAWWIAAGVALVFSCACEYGPVGALMVTAALWYGRTRHAMALAPLSLSLLLVGVVNHSQMGALALPLALAMLAWPIELPRVRRFFYAGYVAQWVFVGVVAWWLR